MTLSPTRSPHLAPRLSALFAAALLGVLVVVGLALSSFGWPVVVVYAVLAVAGLALLARRAPRRPASGQTCTCCTSTVHDPVKVV